MYVSVEKLRNFLNTVAHYTLRTVALAIFCVVAAAHMLITTGLFHALPARADNIEASTAGAASSVETRSNSSGVAMAGTSKITGRVWLDLNRDDNQDGGEPGLPDFTVKLLNSGGSSTIDTVLTGADGTYTFDDLDAGTYVIEVIEGQWRLFCDQDVGPDGADSDVNPNTGKTAALTLGSGETINNVDAGILSVERIGNKVWLDENGNGRQDDAETRGVPNIPMNLLTTSRQPYINPATGQQYSLLTDNAGVYNFRDILPAYLFIEVDIPNYMKFAPGNLEEEPGYHGGNDSDVVDGTNRIASHEYPSLFSSGDRDAGVLPAGIGSKIWQDLNQNDKLDESDPGVQNALVKLIWAGADEAVGGDDVLYAQVTTGADGTYSFPAVVPGYYYLNVDLPEGNTFVDPGVGNEAEDSDADPATGNTSVFLLSSEQTRTDVSAGAVPGELVTASIGDRVWLDLNGNSLQDGGEPGVENVTVNLLEGNGNATGRTTTTSASGSYVFTGVTPGTYMVEFVLPANDMTFVDKDQGNDEIDSDVDPGTGRTSAKAFNVGSDTSIDAGVVAPATPTPTPTNTPVTPTNTPVTPTSTPVTPEATETPTPGNGGPTETPTPTSTGTISVTPTPSETPVETGEPTPTNTPELGSTATATPGTTATPVPSPTPTVAPNTAALGDSVWLDLNFDGLQSEGEPGVEGVTVTLLDASGLETGLQVTTDANGHYRFSELTETNYLVQFTAPAGSTFVSPNAGDDTLDSDADPDTGRTSLLILTLGTENTTVDAGIVPGVITGMVYNDANGNGTRDAGESGKPGVKLILSDEEVRSAGTADVGSVTDDLLHEQSTVTDANGEYRFVVLPGAYTITPESTDGVGGINGSVIQVSVQSGETMTDQHIVGSISPEENRQLWLPVIRTNE